MEQTELHAENDIFDPLISWTHIAMVGLCLFPYVLLSTNFIVQLKKKNLSIHDHVK